MDNTVCRVLCSLHSFIHDRQCCNLYLLDDPADCKLPADL